MAEIKKRIASTASGAGTVIRTAKAALFPAAPPYLIFFITHRCNARCGFCFDRGYAEGKDGEELTLSEIEKIAARWQGVLQVTLTGGEPFTRDDVFEIASAWAAAGARSLTIATNGIMTEKILSATEKLLAARPGIMLDVNVSIDGPAHVHDELRGVPGAHRSAMATARALSALARRHPRLRAGATVTVSAFNQDTAADTVRELICGDLFGRVQALWIRGRPHDPAALDAEFSVYEECGRLLAGFKGSSGASRIKETISAMVRESIVATVREDRMLMPCKAGATMVEVDAFGEVFPCEMLWQLKPDGAPGQGIDSWSFGSLPEMDCDIGKVMGTEKARLIKDWIRRTGCYCTFECAFYNNIIFSPTAWPRVLWRLGRPPG